MKFRVLLDFPAHIEEGKPMLRGIAKDTRVQQGWEIFLDDAWNSKTHLRWLYEGKWHGVISLVSPRSLVEACARMHLPLIDLSDSTKEPGVSKVRPDNLAIGHMAAEYFLGLGFEHFAYCGYKNNLSSAERRDGFVEALDLVRQKCDVLETESVLDAPQDERQRSISLALWLRRQPHGTGILACSDRLARELLQTALAARLSVPQDIAICGVNNESLQCELFGPALTSIAPNFFEAGTRAARQLDRLMLGETTEIIDDRIEPLDVVKRQSTDILQFREKNVALALRYIQENAHCGIRVDDVLDRVPVSRAQLESKFRRFVGRSPQAEIRRVQVALVCRMLLKEKDWPLKKIAFEAGFSHGEYMHVVFKRIMGETPGQYRENISAQERERAVAQVSETQPDWVVSA